MSWALISATIMALEVEPVSLYMREAWVCLQTRQHICYVHHICRYSKFKMLLFCECTHCLYCIKGNTKTTFILDQIKQEYQQRLQSIELLKKWMYGFVYGKDLWSFCRRVQEAIIICRKPNLTAQVRHAIDNISKGTDRSGKTTITINLCLKLVQK